MGSIGAGGGVDDCCVGFGQALIITYDRGPAHKFSDVPLVWFIGV